MSSQTITTSGPDVGLAVGKNVETANITVGESLTTGNVELGRSGQTGDILYKGIPLDPGSYSPPTVLYTGITMKNTSGVPLDNPVTSSLYYTMVGDFMIYQCIIDITNLSPWSTGGTDYLYLDDFPIFFDGVSPAFLSWNGGSQWRTPMTNNTIYIETVSGTNTMNMMRISPVQDTSRFEELYVEKNVAFKLFFSGIAHQLIPT